MKHNWIGLMSDINTKWYDTYNWYRCSNCSQETEHTKRNDIPTPSQEGCKAQEKGSIFPLSSL